MGARCSLPTPTTAIISCSLNTTASCCCADPPFAENMTHSCCYHMARFVVRGHEDALTTTTCDEVGEHGDAGSKTGRSLRRVSRAHGWQPVGQACDVRTVRTAQEWAEEGAGETEQSRLTGYRALTGISSHSDSPATSGYPWPTFATTVGKRRRARPKPRQRRVSKKEETMPQTAPSAMLNKKRWYPKLHGSRRRLTFEPSLLGQRGK